MNIPADAGSRFAALALPTPPNYEARTVGWSAARAGGSASGSTSGGPLDPRRAASTFVIENTVSLRRSGILCIIITDAPGLRARPGPDHFSVPTADSSLVHTQHSPHP